jgi:hypothetical protein
MTSGRPENPRMTPNRQSPAYALFARRPILPQPPDVLAADPPASQEPLPPSGTEDTPVTECPLPAPAAAAFGAYRQAASPQSRCSRFRLRINQEAILSTAQGGVARKF